MKLQRCNCCGSCAHTVDRVAGCFAGLVLVNSAGKIVPGFAPDGQPTLPAPSSNGRAAGPPALVADLVSAALFLYLETSIAKCALRLPPPCPPRPRTRSLCRMPQPSAQLSPPSGRPHATCLVLTRSFAAALAVAQRHAQ